MRQLPLHLPDLAPRLRASAWSRMLLGHRVLNGLAVGAGLMLLSFLAFLAGGPSFAAMASVGMLIASIGDQVSPAHGKFRQLAPVLLLALPLWAVVQLVRLDPATAGLAGPLIAAGGFIGMLGTAWGVRGAPLGFALVLAMIFALTSPPPADLRALAIEALAFQGGALAYGIYAVVAARLLNDRYRAQALADTLADMAAMLRQQAARFAATADRRTDRIQALLGEQANLADKLQTARDLVLDAPDTPHRHRLAAMLIVAIRLREQALAFELALEDAPPGAQPTAAAARELERQWSATAASLDRLSWALFTGTATGPDALPPLAQGLPVPLQRAAASLGAEAGRLATLMATRDADVIAHDPALVAGWARFRTPTRWPLAPLKRALDGRSPVLRYAVRVALALLAGHAVGSLLPWAAHPQWILLTTAVIMRTNLAQTWERRKARLAGTALGCVIVAVLLSLQPDVPMQLAIVALAVATAHGFAQVRYFIAATAATVLALLQGHLLHTANEFSLLERLVDTAIGAAVASVFSYVLPAWERRQLPALARRLRAAHGAEARAALQGPLDGHGSADWRLARREVYDTLAAMSVASQRALAEPRAERPPLVALERLQLRCYRLLAQLAAVRLEREAAPDAETGRTEMLGAAAADLARLLDPPVPSDTPTGDGHPADRKAARDRPEEPVREAGLDDLRSALDRALGEAREVGRGLAAIER